MKLSSLKVLPAMILAASLGNETPMALLTRELARSLRQRSDSSSLQRQLGRQDQGCSVLLGAAGHGAISSFSIFLQPILRHSGGGQGVGVRGNQRFTFIVGAITPRSTRRMNSTRHF